MREKNPVVVQLKRAVKKTSRFFVTCTLNKDETGNVPHWSSFATFEFFATNDRSADVVKYPQSISVPGIMGTGKDDEEKGYRPMKGSWSLWNSDIVRSAILSIPDDAKLTFEVRLDYHTTPNMRDVGLHGDHISILAEWQRNGKTECREFLLDVMVCKHNTARFGAPGSVVAA